MKKYCYYTAPFGQLLLVAEHGKLEQVIFPNQEIHKIPKKSWIEDKTEFKIVISQFKEYFSGKRKTFSIDLNPVGTVFQKQVWKELEQIPYGTTINYGELANRIGNPKASRAVGGANGKNPIPVIIPCHRVIGKDGSLTGFGGGITIKEHLLRLETAID